MFADGGLRRLSSESKDIIRYYDYERGYQRITTKKFDLDWPSVFRKDFFVGPFFCFQQWRPAWLAGRVIDIILKGHTH